MHKQIFVNLPVNDIGKTREFFGSLGFAFNPQFSDERALCMIIGENIYAMLLQESYFQTFTTKPVADARTSTEVLTCLSCDSREQVDSLVAKALAGGGRAPVAGQLKVCSRGLYFVPRDVHDPIVRIPFASTTAIEE